MPFSAAAVANAFLDLAYRDQRAITPLKLQKLVYFAHGWHLAITGRPLLKEHIQAWQWGPVIPSLYQQFKEVGSGYIRFPASLWKSGDPIVPKLENEGRPDSEVAVARQIIARVWEQYSQYSAAQLTTLTHADDAPWTQTPNKEEYGTVIPDDLIRSYFIREAAVAR